MTKIDFAVTDVSRSSVSQLSYSFCTLVTNIEEYRMMVELFRRKGFDDDCEFLYIDNSVNNAHDSYSGYNHFLQLAKGKYIILCHQDILPVQDDRAKLDSILQALTEMDPNWGCCGNVGVDAKGVKSYRISDSNYKDANTRDLPKKVMSLDENFIVVRKDSNLALSRDLSGFHWYGSDICIMADVLGWSCYVIDFLIFHKSAGNIDAHFIDLARSVRRKYLKAFRARRQYVPTNHPLYISGSHSTNFVGALIWKIGRYISRLRPPHLRS